MPYPSALYVHAESKGRFLFDSLQRRINDPDAHDVVQANVEIHYTVECWEGVADLGTPALENALYNDNIDTESWTQLSVTSNGSPDRAYTNYISATQGSIICANNNKMDNRNDPGSRLQWSEILFQVYQMEASKRLQELGQLRTIWRFWIVNPDITKIIGEAKSFSSSEYGGSYIKYRPSGSTNDSGFFALLGRPNGRGIGDGDGQGSNSASRNSCVPHGVKIDCQSRLIRLADGRLRSQARPYGSGSG